jgi:hypothetical protein
MEETLQWKRNLKAVMDNPNYIEEKIGAIQKELQKNDPNTDYLREKVKLIEKWLDEIDLAKKRFGDVM